MIGEPHSHGRCDPQCLMHSAKMIEGKVERDCGAVVLEGFRVRIGMSGMTSELHSYREVAALHKSRVGAVKVGLALVDLFAKPVLFA